MCVRVSSTGLPCLLPPEAGLCLPQLVLPSGFPAPEEWTLLGAYPGLPLLFLVLQLLWCPRLGPGAFRGEPRGPKAAQLAGKGCTVPRPDWLSPTLHLLSFSSGATGFFCPPDEVTGGVGGGLWLGRDSGLLSGEVAQQRASWTLGACVSHIPSQPPSHIPLSCTPQPLTCQGPPLFPVLAAPLPSSGSNTGIHSVCITHARCWHTLLLGDTVSHTLPLTHTQCPCHYTHVHPCTPTRPCTGRATHSSPMSWLLDAKDGATLEMLSCLTPPPPTSATAAAPGSPLQDCWSSCSHMCEHKHTTLLACGVSAQAALPCTPPTVRCASVCGGVSCSLSVCQGSIHPQSPAIYCSRCSRCLSPVHG